MSYASLDGLEGRLGAQAYADWLAAAPNPQAALAGCEARVLACILPCRPRSEGQRLAVERAVYAQLAFELDAPPEGVESFTLGAFSAKLGARSALCREAGAILLGAGLMCREVVKC